MRFGLLAAVVLASISGLAAWQEPKRNDANKNKPTVVVIGCFDGSWLRVKDGDGFGPHREDFVVRSTKQQMKELAKEHKNQLLEVTGYASDGPGTRRPGSTIPIGTKARISTDAKESESSQGAASTLEVTSFRVIESHCKR